MKIKNIVCTIALAVVALLSVPAAQAQTVYSDNFQRANENPLQAPWKWFGGYFQLFNNLIQPQFGASNGYGGAYMYEGPIATDQFSQITVKTVNASSFVGAAVRYTHFGSGTAWYEFHTGGPLGGQGYVYLEKYNSISGGSYLKYALATVNSGDVLKLTAIGNVLTCYINGVQIMQATDSDYTSGWFGASAYAGSLATDAQISAWSGGSLTNTPSGTFNLTAAPPTSSTPCTPGDASYDSAYVYVCVAQNKWLRGPLATF
jgi:hypothetical protein